MVRCLACVGVALVVGLSSVGCSSGSHTAPLSAPEDASTTTDAGPAIDGGGPATDAEAGPAPQDAHADGDTGSTVVDRPYHFKVPKGYDASKPTPLVIMLHGYSVDATIQESYFKVSKLADEKTFLYAFPDGTIDFLGKRFWNASDACCNFAQVDIDDVGYVNAIMDDVAAKYNVDPKRVFVVGHSNGGFMSHRIACELSPRVAAIASLAGVGWKDATRCKPSAPVAVLQIHGDADETIAYEGGAVDPRVPVFPSAKDSTRDWAKRNGCNPTIGANGTPLDLDSKLAGAETTVQAYSGCQASVELWTIAGGAHIPDIQPNFAELVYAFLMANPKK